MSRRRDWSRTSWENRYWILAAATSSFDEPLDAWRSSSIERKPLPKRKISLAFKVGQRVTSKRFGDGKIAVLDMSGRLATVVFGHGRWKKLLRFEELKPLDRSF